jgi:two-component system, cell cycle response regulator CpdR
MTEPPPLPRSVMVVDDSGVFGFTLSLEFRKAGWDVFCCGSAEDALKKVKEATKDFDLILSDVFMPGMRGDEFASAVLQAKPGQRIILMSGMPREGLPPMPKGVAYIPKPVNVPMVLQAFDRIAKPQGGARA